MSGSGTEIENLPAVMLGQSVVLLMPEEVDRADEPVLARAARRQVATLLATTVGSDGPWSESVTFRHQRLP